MSYDKEILAKASAVLSERRNRSQTLLADHRSEIAMKIPEIDSLNRELLSTNVHLTKIILGHTENTARLIQQLRDRNLEAQAMIRRLLQEHGYPENYLELQYTCSDCKDTGVFHGKNCHCFKDLIVKFSIEKLNSASPLALSDFSSFCTEYYPEQPDPDLHIVPREHMRKIFEYCSRYADTFSMNSPSLLLLGPTGLGKTHLSLAIAKTVIEKGYTVLYGSAQDVLRKIEQDHFSRDGNEEETMQTLLNTDLLVLDDLGAEYSSAFTVASVYNIINSRLSLCKPTIINSNLTTKDLETRYSDRIVSRLLTQYTYLRFTGSDIRQILRNNGRNE